MKKFTTIKTLLVGLCAMGATSAWADTYYSESYSSSSTTEGWSTATSGRFTPVILSEDDNYFLSVTQDQRNNNGTTVTGTVVNGKVAAGNDFTMTFDMKLSNSNNQTPVVLEIKDAANSGVIFSLTATATNSTTWKINGTDTQVTLPNSGGGMGINDITWCSYKISRSGSLTYVTIINKADNTTIFERATVGGASATGGLGNIVFTTKRYNANFGIDNIVVRDLEADDVPVITPTTYTIKYVDESNAQIAEDKVVDSYVGAENITASALETAAIYYNDQKYLYSSGNEAITLVKDASSNVITLVYRKANSYTYSVNAVDADKNILKALISSENGFEEDVIYARYPVYVLVDGELWTCPATSQSFKKSFTLTENNQVYEITYTKSDINNVVFYAEGEEVEGMTVYQEGNSDARSSKAGMGYAANDVTFTTLEPGKYVLTFVQYNAGSAAGTMTFVVGGNEFSQTTSSSNWTSKTFDEFTLNATSDLVLKAGGNTNLGVDFVYIQKTGEVELPTNVTVEVSDAGWATLFSDYALNFEDTGLTAYTATLSESTVTLTEVTSVTAGTGVVLKGAANTYEIPVIDGSDTAKGDLKGDATAATTANGSQYILVMNGSNAQFTKATSGSIAAGKAYLENAGSESRILNIVFAGEATGIKAIETVQADGNVYNMAGQRVAAPQKGLFIMNGKKVIIK